MTESEEAALVRLVKSMRVLRLLPGDIVVFMTDHYISDEMAFRLKTSFDANFNELGVKVMVLGDGLKVGALRRADAAKLKRKRNPQ